MRAVGEEALLVELRREDVRAEAGDARHVVRVADDVHMCTAEQTLVLVADKSGLVRLWNAQTAQHLRDFGGSTGEVSGAALTADGKFVSYPFAPGPVDTDIMGGTLSDERKADMSKDILVGRVGTVRDMAALLAFLVGQDAGFITAATYDINGGLQIS